MNIRRSIAWIFVIVSWFTIIPYILFMISMLLFCFSLGVYELFQGDPALLYAIGFLGLMFGSYWGHHVIFNENPS